ncbi:MAG: BMC domain-containing protein [Clostridioides sp.]|jgi:microcompartment protein CcmL/EutN|nr:BMC domain-containing protein [Clostridioides sp.]
MQALGLIEVRGLISAIEAADVMLKSADVSIIEKTIVGGGLVTVSVTGDVGAVKAAVEAGAAAVNNLNSATLVSEHVIPRPDNQLENIIKDELPPDDPEKSDIEVVETPETADKSAKTEVKSQVEITVEDVLKSESVTAESAKIDQKNQEDKEVNISVEVKSDEKQTDLDSKKESSPKAKEKKTSSKKKSAKQDNPTK